MKEENKIDLSMALEVHLHIFRHIILETQHIFTGRQISIHFDLNICLTPFKSIYPLPCWHFLSFFYPNCLLLPHVPKGESKPALVHHSPNPDSRAVMYVLNSPQSIVLLLCILYFHNIKKKIHNNVKKASLWAHSFVMRKQYPSHDSRRYKWTFNVTFGGTAALLKVFLGALKKMPI